MINEASHLLFLAKIRSKKIMRLKVVLATEINIFFKRLSPGINDINFKYKI